MGSAGGLCYCRTHSVKILNSWSDVFSVSVLVDDLSNKSKWLITYVYGHNDSQRRKEFWKELDVIRGGWGCGVLEEAGI